LFAIMINCKFVIIIILLGFSVSAHAIPVMTNKAMIEGTVSGYCLESSATEGIKPEQVLYKLIISVEDVMAELYFRLQVDAGLKELNKGHGIPQKEVEKRMSKWLSK